MKSANEIACAISVKLMFMFDFPGGHWSSATEPAVLVKLAGSDDGEQRVAEREQHGNADADNERGVDQAE